VWRMEDVLDLYEEPCEAERPVVCFDELPCQLVAEKRTPLPATTGHPARYDYTSMSAKGRPMCSRSSSPRGVATSGGH
jgi:hypothetical protein